MVELINWLLQSRRRKRLAWLSSFQVTTVFLDLITATKLKVSQRENGKGSQLQSRWELWRFQVKVSHRENRKRLLITITITITMGTTMMKISELKLKLVQRLPLILVKLPNCNRCPLTETKNIENAGNNDEDNIMKVFAGWKVSLNTYPLLESWNVIVQKG